MERATAFDFVLLVHSRYTFSGDAYLWPALAQAGSDRRLSYDAASSPAPAAPAGVQSLRGVQYARRGPAARAAWAAGPAPSTRWRVTCSGAARVPCPAARDGVLVVTCVVGCGRGESRGRGEGCGERGGAGATAFWVKHPPRRHCWRCAGHRRRICPSWRPRPAHGRVAANFARPTCRARRCGCAPPSLCIAPLRHAQTR